MSVAPAGTTFRFRRLDLAAADETTRATVRSLVRRGAVPDRAVRDGVRAILDDVRTRGVAAVREASDRFGGGPADGAPLILARDALRAAAQRLEPDARRALDQAIANVRRFAESQLPATTKTQVAAGVEIERRWTPLRRVGCYVPGGSAPYPSSLVMTVVPARVAGVGEVVVASPADASGRLDPVLLGAAGLLGVDSLLVAGGAQAIGALAFGLPSENLEPVDRIVGPGNAWVTAAKLEVSGLVGIDVPAGPSEGMVLADSTADPAIVAADLVTQAEHGPDSPAILVTTDAGLADAVDREVAALLPRLERREILERALRDHGWVALAPDRRRAIDFVNAYAPEHLSIDVADVESAVAAIESAGSVFVGRWAPESAGDYATGANHVLPTGGLARSCGPLSVEAYGRYSQVQRLDRDGLLAIGDTIRTLATAEGLTAHRNAVDVRFRAEGGPAE
ncbi:MAG TPA: histidinol dehydrogenase [Candidatus Limnocylindrales bacterium]|nr:histidinol dehydrogenase [Candidatus Limnocylindrales bacterium]